jgi:hypothetical protein
MIWNECILFFVVVDFLRNGSNETERTHSSISTKSEYEDINHDVIDKAGVFEGWRF